MSISTVPPTTDIACYAGDTLRIKFVTTVDYSAWTWSAEVRQSYADADADATFTFTPSVPNGQVWECYGELTAAATEALMDEVKPPVAVISRPNPYKGVWDLQIEDGSGTVRTLVSGKFVCSPDVTRS
jgi:hypothetical protein